MVVCDLFFSLLCRKYLTFKGAGQQRPFLTHTMHLSRQTEPLWRLSVFPARSQTPSDEIRSILFLPQFHYLGRHMYVVRPSLGILNTRDNGKKGCFKIRTQEKWKWIFQLLLVNTMVFRFSLEMGTVYQKRRVYSILLLYKKCKMGCLLPISYKYIYNKTELKTRNYIVGSNFITIFILDTLLKMIKPGFTFVFLYV